jgi:hypothetical protein
MHDETVKNGNMYWVLFSRVICGDFLKSGLVVSPEDGNR